MTKQSEYCRGPNKRKNVFYLINDFLAWIALVVLFSLMCLTFGDVAGRYFSKSIPGTYELTEMGMVLIVFFSLGYTQIRKGHVRIDLLESKMSPRVQTVIDSITYLVTLILISLMAWQLLLYAKRQLEGNEMSGVLHIPLFIFSVTAAAGSAAYALAILVDMYNSVMKGVKKNAP